MSKKRKTRQEKIIAELRRKLNTESPAYEDQTSVSHKPLPTYTYSSSLPSKNLTASSQSTMISKTFLFQDIVKISILTSSIVIFELILFFLLKIK